MRWKQGAPTQAGIYLRSNPPISQIVRQDVFWLNGVLVVSHPENPLSATPVTELCDRFWWFGPIPQPNWKTQPTGG